MLEEDHRIVAAQARAQQADGVFRVRRHRHLPARRMDELHLVGLAVPRIAAFEEADRACARTIGAAKRLLVRQRIVPQSLSCSVAGSAYLRNWISGTGISPAIAMPTARPMMPSSDRLVSNTRASPNFSCRPERHRMDAALRPDILAEHQHARIDRELVLQRAADRRDHVDALAFGLRVLRCEAGAHISLRPLPALRLAFRLRRRHGASCARIGDAAAPRRVLRASSTALAASARDARPIPPRRTGRARDSPCSLGSGSRAHSDSTTLSDL